ncbi:MAG: hypothetical protein K2X27_11610 [Candidatus Obscuribacterales bacterium]|nr:hypothetical protein [Candidatus Obscuribacterales bacterium]
MPDDKPSEKPKEEVIDDKAKEALRESATTPGNTDKPVDSKAAGSELEKKGILPETRLDGAGPKPGAQVEYGGEKWVAKGTHEGRSILYQDGRGRDFAGQFLPVDGKPDPAKFKELPKFEGQPPGTSYYADKAGNVFHYHQLDGNKGIMTTAHDVTLVNPEKLASQVKGGEPKTEGKPEVKAAEPKAETKPDVKASDPKPSGDGPKSEYKELKVDGKVLLVNDVFSQIARTGRAPEPAVPKTGAEVEYKGEKLNVAGYEGNVALLQKTGRNADFAGIATPVTDAQLESKYQKVQVTIDGKQETRYMEKGKPGNGVMKLMDFGSQKTLWPDHEFEVVKKTDLVKTEKPAEVSKAPETAKVETAPAKPGEAPKVGSEVKFNGEKMNVAAYVGNTALLHQEGRNADYAVISSKVTDAELKANFYKVDVTIDGKQTARYIDRSKPGFVMSLSEHGGNKFLTPDHSFEMVSKAELIKQQGTTAEAPKTPEKPVDKTEPKAPEKAPDKAPEKAAANTEGRSPDAEVKDGKMSDGKPATERSREVDGKKVTVRTPEEHGRFFREVTVDGKTIKLTMGYPQQWFYSEGGGGESKDKAAEQVKLHVTGVSGNDVTRLQAELLPKLEELRAKGLIQQYKTFDPNFIDGKWHDNENRYGREPGPTNNDSKAFTIYAPPDKVQEVAKIIDKVLKDKGLGLPNSYEGNNVGELTRKQSESKRVSVERDMWTATTDKSGYRGALIDESTAKKIEEKFAKNGVDERGKLTPDALRAAEKAAGIAEHQLGYDKDGRLMFLDENHRSEKVDGGRFYADESRANKTPGERTGRPAIYALYELAGEDPAKIHTDAIKAKQEVAVETSRPERVAPKAESLQGTDTKPNADGTLERKDAKPGEVLAREQLERRDRVDAKEIEALRKTGEELAKSEKAADKEKAEAIKRTVDALEGRLGREAQELAHKTMLSESRKALERGEGGGYGRAVTGGLIAVGILTAAALAYYRSQMKESEQRSIERAKVRDK